MNKKRAEARPRKRKIFAIAAIFCAALFMFLFKESFAGLFSPISIVSNIISPNLKSTDGRINILVLGRDSRSVGAEGGLLTDTILFTSIGKNDGSIAMISIPRDLLVKITGPFGSYSDRINSIYGVVGVDELKRVLEEDVIGMPVHYYVVIDFNLFREVIDTLGGVEVVVEHAFVDYEYPIEGMEADLCGKTEEEVKELEEKAEEEEEEIYYLEVFPCRYQTVSFEEGKQVMDGETALKYVRSRHGSNGEGTDFARSRRQQNLIMAVRNKALNIETILDIGKVKSLYEAYSANVDSNITLDDIQSFWVLSQRLEFDSLRSIVLDDRSGADEGGILYSPVDTSLYGGKYVLIPRSGDYSQVRAYVQRYIFGE